MLQHIPPDEDEGDYRYARVDRYRQPLARRRWKRPGLGLPLGAIAVGLSLLCLIGAVIGVCMVVSIVTCCLRGEAPGPASIDTLPDPIPPMLKIMPWVCIGSAFLGLYAYLKSDDTDDKTGLIGALVGGIAFLAWVVARVFGKMYAGVIG